MCVCVYIYIYIHNMCVCTMYIYVRVASDAERADAPGERYHPRDRQHRVPWIVVQGLYPYVYTYIYI